MKNNILESLTLEFLDRIGDTYMSNEAYKEAYEAEDKALEELHESLDQKQRKLLENYFCAGNATIEQMERLLYQQGMKDLLSFLLSLLNKGSDCTLS